MAPVPFRNASSLAIGLVLLLFAATLQAEGDGDAAKQAASQLTLGA